MVVVFSLYFISPQKATVNVYVYKLILLINRVSFHILISFDDDRWVNISTRDAGANFSTALIERRA